MAPADNDAGVLFQDTSTECAICLCPLDDDTGPNVKISGGSDTSGIQQPTANDVITLSCGHRWHLSCISDQLRHAQADRSRRLLFSGCRCAKCAVFCDHESLRHLTRRTDELREEVDALTEEQLQVDAPEIWRQMMSGTGGTNNNGDATDAKINAERESLIDKARRTYAFYLCGSCDTPYFGGTVECADEMGGDERQVAGNNSASSSDERLCPSCTPTLQTACRDPVRHRGHHVWKCRYCCQPATHVCYGSVHFCDACHDRSGQQLRQQQRGSRGPSPLELEPIPCSGGDGCPFPKPVGGQAVHHLNGPSHKCEQVYHCICCRSPEQQQAHEPFGSQNFIQNPSGAQGIRQWTQLSRQARWQVEESDIPYISNATALEGATTTTSYNFVSTFNWCVQAQAVPLRRYVRDPSAVRIEVAAKYMGRTDCPSVFRMEAFLRDGRQQVLRRLDTDPLAAPADAWERASLVFDPHPMPAGAVVHEAVIVVYGKDDRFWQGTFGSKVAECSIRVLCENEEELQTILVPALNENVGNANTERLAHVREVSPRLWRKHIFDHLLIPAAFIFVWWMTSKER